MWIAAIQREVSILADGTMELRGEICQSIIDNAMVGRIEIATSALALAEVCRPPPAGNHQSAKLFDFWRQPYLFMVPLDTAVGQIARALMAGGYAGLKPADATHIASAIAAQAEELQTFDVALLKLDEKIERPNGNKLKIRKPELSATQLMIFDSSSLRSDEHRDKSPEITGPPATANPKADPAPQLSLSAPPRKGIQRRIRFEDEQPDQT